MSGMRVTVGELLGVTTAEEGERLEHEASQRRREEKHADDIAASWARADAKARFGVAPAAVPPAPAPHVLTPDELDSAPWASSGPIALAALLRRPLAEIRSAFPAQMPGRTWTNLRQMHRALDHLRLRYHATQEERAPLPTATGWPAKAWPRRGLVLVQWRGPWEAPERRLADSLRHTQWIAVEPTKPWLEEPYPDPAALVFDANAVGLLDQSDYDAAATAPGRTLVRRPTVTLGGWWSRWLWEHAMAPALAKEHTKATGAWWVRAGIEVLDGGAR